jgi:trk system potassium uptake protein TrkH
MRPEQIIALGFAAVILLGAGLLMLPIAQNKGIDVPFIDALFTSTSAVCVTGLVAIDVADNFNVFGQAVVAALIQIGGLGVTSVGVGLILLARRKVTFKDRILVKEAMNLNSVGGIVRLVKSVLLMTLCFEGTGVILNFIVFSQDYAPLHALWISIFHAIAAFNNSGYDILGGFRNLIPYQNNVLLNLTTTGLIIFGGLGFLVIREMISKRRFRKFSLHTKVVLTMTAILLASGTVLLKATENISWLGAFFFSTSARTAGFSTYQLGEFSNAGLFLLIILMFIGASPGSTGGGIKTTTAFAMLKSAYSMATNKHCTAFKRRIPGETIRKAFIVFVLALSLICLNSYLLSILEPQFTFIQLLFEVVSAFGTVGLSTGITPDLGVLSKAIIILTMYIGRLGPLTVAMIWYYRPLSYASYSEETITIG